MVKQTFSPISCLSYKVIHSQQYSLDSKMLSDIKQWRHPSEINVASSTDGSQVWRLKFHSHLWVFYVWYLLWVPGTFLKTTGFQAEDIDGWSDDTVIVYCSMLKAGLQGFNYTKICNLEALMVVFKMFNKKGNPQISCLKIKLLEKKEANPYTSWHMV